MATDYYPRIESDRQLQELRKQISAAANGFKLFANETAANTYFTNNPPAEDVLFKYTDAAASKAEFYRRASDNSTQELTPAGLTDADKSPTPSPGGTDLFTTGGAQNLKVDLESGITSVNTQLEALNKIIDIKKFFRFNGTSSKASLASEIHIVNDDDFFEWRGAYKNDQAPAEDVYGLYAFGKDGENTNTSGYYTDGSGNKSIRVRTSTGSYVDLLTPTINFQSVLVIRFTRSGSNVVLTVNEVVIDTRPIDAAPFIFKDVARAGGNPAIFAKIDLYHIKARAQGVNYAWYEFTGDDWTDTDVEERDETKLIELSNNYYTVDLDGSISGDELVTVYTQIKDTIYQASRIAHLVNATASDLNGVKPHSDLWRLYGAYEVELIDGAFVSTGRNILHTSENEDVYHENDNATDFTGGYHGFEELTGVRILADDKEISLGSDIPTPIACKKFEYMQSSLMYDHGNYPAEAAIHFKRTNFSKPGYTVFKHISPKIPILGGTWFAGLSCVSTGIASSWFADDLIVKTALYDNKEKDVKVGKDPTLFYSKAGTGYTAEAKGYFTNVLIGGVQQKDVWNEAMKTEVYDRTTDLKYYRRGTGFANVDNGDYIESIFELKITLK